MAAHNGRTTWLAKVTGSLIVRLVCYYAVLVSAMVLIWRYMPRTEVIAHESMDALFGSLGAGLVEGGRRARAAVAPLDQTTLAVTVALAMIALGAPRVADRLGLHPDSRQTRLSAIRCADAHRPATGCRGNRRAREVQRRARVQPCRHRGRGALPEYARRQQGRGLHLSRDGDRSRLGRRSTGGAGDLGPVQCASRSRSGTRDFGRPPALEGRIAERRLQRAMEQLSRTGSFVARIDDHVYSRKCPPSSSQRSRTGPGVAHGATIRRHRIPTANARRCCVFERPTSKPTRLTIEPLLDEHLKRWRYGGVVHEPDGTHVVEFAIVLKKAVPAEQLMGILRMQEPVAHVEIA